MLDTGWISFQPYSLSVTLNLFSATMPGADSVVPGAHTLQYRLVVRATRRNETATLTTGFFSMDGLLVQQ